MSSNLSFKIENVSILSGLANENLNRIRECLIWVFLLQKFRFYLRFLFVGALPLKPDWFKSLMVSHRQLRLNPPKRRYLRAFRQIRLRPYGRVRTKPSLPKIIENSGVLVACKSCVAFLG